MLDRAACPRALRKAPARKAMRVRTRAAAVKRADRAPVSTANPKRKANSQSQAVARHSESSPTKAKDRRRAAPDPRPGKALPTRQSRARVQPKARSAMSARTVALQNPVSDRPLAKLIAKRATKTI